MTTKIKLTLFTIHGESIFLFEYVSVSGTGYVVVLTDFFYYVF